MIKSLFLARPIDLTATTHLVCLRILFLGIFLFTAGSSLVGASFPESFKIRPSEPQKVELQLVDLEKKRVRLSDLKGKVILLNFWATWCYPCLAEMPALEKLWNTYREKGFLLITVAVDGEKERVIRNYIKRKGYSFPVLLDPEGKEGERLGVSALPFSILINRQGIKVGEITGSRKWDGKVARTVIEALLE